MKNSNDFRPAGNDDRNRGQQKIDLKREKRRIKNKLNRFVNDEVEDEECYNHFEQIRKPGK